MTLKFVAEELYKYFLQNYSRPETVVISGDSGDGYANFLRITVSPSLNRQHTLGRIGNRTYERIGVVTVQCFGEDEATAYDIADEVLRIFEGTEVAGTTIYFKNITTTFVGRDDPYYQINLTVEYEHTDRK